MGRPSLKSQRAEEILHAFERCVARYGLEGSTLERIAEEAGLARALIRHNIGNRESLIEKLIETTIKKAEQAMHELLNYLPETEPAKAMVEYLFNTELADQQLNLVLGSLIAGSFENPEMARRMNAWFRGFVDVIKRVLNQQFKSSDIEQQSIVASGIAGIYFNADAVLPLGDVNEFRQESKAAALLLLGSLT